MAPNESKNTSDGETGKEEINFDDATPTTLVFFVNGKWIIIGLAALFSIHVTLFRASVI